MNIRKTRLFLTTHSTQRLVQAPMTFCIHCYMLQMSCWRLHWSVWWSPEYVGTSTLQPTDVGSGHHVAPLTHWLPIATHIKFMSHMPTYSVLTGSAPLYFNILVWVHAAPHLLRSAHQLHLAKPFVGAWQSRLFSYIRFYPICVRHAGNLFCTDLTCFDG